MPRMNTLARKYFPFVLIPNFLYYDKFIAEMKRKLTLSFKQKAIVTNVVWSLGGKIVNMVSALFVGILVARYLGPENYGIMNYVISYVSIFTIVATFGMSNIEIRELSRNKEKKNSILGTCFIIRVCFSLIAYLGVVLSLFVFQIDRFTTIMILVYGLTLFTGISELSRNYFISIVENKYIVKSEIFRTLVGAIVKIGLLFLKAPLEYFIIAQVFDTFLVASGYYYSYKVIVGSVRNWTFDKTIVPFFIKESFPLLLSGAAIVIYQRIDQVMIGNMLNKTEVGYFATAGKFVDLILFLPAILVQTITPILVREKECDSYSYEAKKRTFVVITTWVSLLMALAISLSAYWMIIYTYGEKYALAIPVLQIMAFKAVGMALSAAGGQIIIIEHIQKWAFIRNVLGCFLCVILNYLFIPKYGIIGSAIVTVITVFFTGCISNIFIPSYHKILKLQIYAMFWGWKDMVYFKQIIRR